MTDTDTRLAAVEEKLDALLEKAEKAEKAFRAFLSGPGKSLLKALLR